MLHDQHRTLNIESSVDPSFDTRNFDVRSIFITSSHYDHRFLFDLIDIRPRSD